jgi:hypothetical protein
MFKISLRQIGYKPCPRLPLIQTLRDLAVQVEISIPHACLQVKIIRKAEMGWIIVRQCQLLRYLKVAVFQRQKRVLSQISKTKTEFNSNTNSLAL